MSDFITLLIIIGVGLSAIIIAASGAAMIKVLVNSLFGFGYYKRLWLYYALFFVGALIILMPTVIFASDIFGLVLGVVVLIWIIEIPIFYINFYSMEAKATYILFLIFSNIGSAILMIAISSYTYFILQSILY